jgi:hypothetical protein
MTALSSLARRRPSRSGLVNAGWNRDNYPELNPLDAGVTIDLADLDGPGVVTCLHVLQHLAVADGNEEFVETGKTTEKISESDDLLRAVARGLTLEVYYNGSLQPAVRCPLSDFFADGCLGKAVNYSTPFVEKLPRSYNCYFPMPFEKHIRITLRNDTPYDLSSYSFVEYEHLLEWDPALLYFHCAWEQRHFQLTPDTILPLIRIPGRGHLVGSQFSVVTAEPVFKDFFFIMEGNLEHRIDGEEKPSIDYLGTEDGFGFSWGFREVFCGLHSGINYLQTAEFPNELSIYRFRDQNTIQFERELDIRINWQHEFTLGKTRYDTFLRRKVRQAGLNGGAWVDYATAFYWYQEEGPQL